MFYPDNEIEDTIANLANFVASGSIQRAQNAVVNINGVTPSAAGELNQIASRVATDLGWPIQPSMVTYCQLSRLQCLHENQFDVSSLCADLSFIRLRARPSATSCTGRPRRPEGSYSAAWRSSDG